MSGVPKGKHLWFDLMTSDPGAAKEKGEPMDMGPMGIYQIFHEGGPAISGMMNLPDGMPVSAWMYYVRVGDIDGTLERVTANGGKVLNEPMDVPGGDKIAQCLVPQGAAFALHMSAPRPDAGASGCGGPALAP